MVVPESPVTPARCEVASHHDFMTIPARRGARASDRDRREIGAEGPAAAASSSKNAMKRGHAAVMIVVSPPGAKSHSFTRPSVVSALNGVA